MIAAWMLYSVVVGVLVSTAAAAAERVCAALRQPVRFVWVAALAGTVLLSGLGLVRFTTASAAPAPLPAEQVAMSSEAVAVDMDAASRWVGAGRATFASGQERVYGAVVRVSGDGRLLAALWAVASLALITLFAHAVLRFGRARRGWREELVADVTVYVARDTGPAVVGFRRPVIVVPAWLLRASEQDRRLVVQHEQEHRSAHDHVLLAAACAALCLLPWNPALWWTLRRTRLAVELDCDARVLRRGVGAGDYGRLLLNVASRAAGLPLAAPALADTRTQLERRIVAMTRRNTNSSRAWIAATCTTLLVLAACSADLPTAAEIEQMDVAAAETHIKLSGQVVEAGEELIFVVDGVVTPAEEARAITPERIASIEIAKGRAAQEFREGVAGVVHVWTKDAAAVSPSDDAAAKIRVRGNAAVAPAGRLEIRPADAAGLGKQPLFIVDGEVAPADFSPASLDPTTIERIEVIKSPAALRVYGERGANGVIRITLKK